MRIIEHSFSELFKIFLRIIFREYLLRLPELAVTVETELS